MDFGAPRRLQHWVATYTEVPLSAALHPQGFSPSRRFDSTHRLPVLFHTGAIHRLCTFRGFPPRVADSMSPSSLSSVPFPVRTSRPTQPKLTPSLITPVAAPRIYASCGSVPPRPVLPGCSLADPLVVLSPTRFSPPQSRPRASTKPPLLGFGIPLGQVPSVCLLCRVSKN